MHNDPIAHEIDQILFQNAMELFDVKEEERNGEKGFTFNLPRAIECSKDLDSMLKLSGDTSVTSSTEYILEKAKEVGFKIISDKWMKDPSFPSLKGRAVYLYKSGVLLSVIAEYKSPLFTDKYLNEFKKKNVDMSVFETNKALEAVIFFNWKANDEISPVMEKILSNERWQAEGDIYVGKYNILMGLKHIMKKFEENGEFITPWPYQVEAPNGIVKDFETNKFGTVNNEIKLAKFAEPEELY